MISPSTPRRLSSWCYPTSPACVPPKSTATRVICRGPRAGSRCPHPAGTFVDGRRVGPPTSGTGIADGSAYLTIGSHEPLFSDASEAQLDALHAVPAPAEVKFTGIAQVNRDSSHAITSRLPMVLGIIAAITFVLLFLLTGSVVLPLKALVLNVLSLSAAFGALVWIFQDGHLGALGTTSTGSVGGQPAGAVVLHRIRTVHGLRGVPGLADP